VLTAHEPAADEADEAHDMAIRVKLENVMGRLGVSRQYAQSLLLENEGQAGLAILAASPIVRPQPFNIFSRSPGTLILP
jgi:hypothetical protein